MTGFYANSNTRLRWGNKVPGLQPTILSKTRLDHSYFLVTFGKSFRTIILEATVRESFTAQLFRQVSQILSVIPATESIF